MATRAAPAGYATVQVLQREDAKAGLDGRSVGGGGDAKAREELSLLVDSNGGRVKNLYNTLDAPDEAAAAQNNPTLQTFPYLQVMLISVSLLGILVVTILAHDKESWLDFGELELSRMSNNAITAFFFFLVSDLVAQSYQALPRKRKSGIVPPVKLNFGRATRAGCLGIFLNGLGNTLWLHELNLVFPDHFVDGPSYDDLGHLMAKALLDSLLWGTFSNTLGIVGRRVLEGDSLEHAINIWVDKILGVTVKEFGFWPFWSACNFYIVPKQFRVLFNSLGAFVWNCYLSYVSTIEPLDVGYRRVSVVVDGHDSPTRTYIPRSPNAQIIDELILEAETGRHNAALNPPVTDSKG